VGDGGFASWYRAEHGRLLGSLYALTHDLEAATEATDESFARALAAWPKVSEMSYPEAWLHRVGINLVIRQHRRDRSEQKALTALSYPDPQADLYIEVWEAIAALPLRQRTAVVLRYLADLPEAAIA
jgi:RNA polymerase sigma-70 factor (ECF subfamily)